MVNVKVEGDFKIHNARFYNLSPRAINCFAFNKKSSKLALSREDASIEIWNLQYAPYLHQVIYGSQERSIEALGWSNDRLFSTGLTGELIEWNLQKQEIKEKLLLYGSSAWCLDISHKSDFIVIGTEGGYINVYDISSEDEINYVKVFDRQEGKILCCKFDRSGDFVVTGSPDTIRVWEMKTGHAIHKLSISRLETKRETLVWTLAVLQDFTIIAGDSRGYITVWNGKIGSQIDSFSTMKYGDVLAIAISEDEKMFACAGVDPKIKLYALTEVKKENNVNHTWVKFLQRVVHEHDVKSLIFVGNRVLSGGIDGYLGLSTATKMKSDQTITKFGPFLEQPLCILASKRRLLVLKYLNYIEIWKLGTPKDNIHLNESEGARDRKLLALEQAPEKLIQLRSVKDETVACATISSNGELLIYSTTDSIRVFKLIYDKNDRVIEIIRIRDLPEQLTACTKCIFSDDSKNLFVVNGERNIIVCEVNTNDCVEIDYIETIDTRKFIKNPIINVLLSHCGSYLVCAGLCCNIAVWKRNRKQKRLQPQWEHHINLPKYVLPPTAMAIHQNSPKLVAVFADSKLFEYHLEDMKFVCSTTQHFVENQDLHAVQNIVLDPLNENVFICQNDEFVFSVKKIPRNAPNQSEETPKKTPKKTRNSTDQEKIEYKFSNTSKYGSKHLLSISLINERELLAVGINPIILIEQLPMSLKEKKFGIS